MARERHVVARTAVHDLTLDVSGCASREDVRKRLVERVGTRQGVMRLTVEGELQPVVDLREDDLRDALRGRFDALRIRFGVLRAGYDLDEIRREPTVRGQFVRDVLAARLAEDETRRVLAAGLRALEGRTDLEVP